MVDQPFSKGGDGMPGMEIHIAHWLPRDEALKRIKTLLGTLRATHGDQIKDPTETWEGYSADFSFNIRGVSATGTMTVWPREIVIKGSIPIVALPFKRKIEAAIRQEAGRALS
jgi:hypothetical protein